MRVEIDLLGREEVEGAIRQIAKRDLSSVEEIAFETCVTMSKQIWAGFIDGRLVCAWGAIPPTLLSTQAHLWLYCTELLDEHKFIFIRSSQRILEELLCEYELIVGYVMVDNPRAQRWLVMLGAILGERDGNRIPFKIRRKHG
jgi:hypothetical protein